MRQGRIKAPGEPDCAFYHCTNRAVDRHVVLAEGERQKFLSLVREYEIFCGVRVLTFNITEDEFLLVLQVPKAPTKPLTDEELLVRIESLTGTAGGKKTRKLLTRLRASGQDEAAETLRNRFLARMWDVSQFMKLLEQRFAQWFNKQHDRTGTFWASRFKSVLIEGEGEALAAVAAYVEMEAARDRLANDPAHYPWCGLGQALAGDKNAQESLRIVLAASQHLAATSLSVAEAMTKYPLLIPSIAAWGEPVERIDAASQSLSTLTAEEVLEIIGRNGQVPLQDYLKLKVRYFIDGMVLGSQTYVNGVSEAIAVQSGTRRKRAARRMEGVESENLYVLGNLKKNVFSCVQKTRDLRAGTGGVAVALSASEPPTRQVAAVPASAPP